MDHTLHLHLHLYAPCAAKHQMPLSLQYWKYSLWKKTESDEQTLSDYKQKPTQMKCFCFPFFPQYVTELWSQREAGS